MAVLEARTCNPAVSTYRQPRLNGATCANEATDTNRADCGVVPLWGMLVTAVHGLSSTATMSLYILF